MARTKKVKKEAVYTAYALVQGKKYEATGDSVLAALKNLEVRNVRGKSIITMTDGTKSKERVLSPIMTMRLFSLSPLMRQIAFKQAALLLEL